MPAPRLAAKPTKNVGQLLMRRHGRRKERRQSGDRSIHQSLQPRLDDLQREETLFSRHVTGAQAGVGDLSGCIHMASLFLRQVAEQLPDARVGRAARRRLIKPFGFHLHQFHLLLRGLEAQRTRAPQRSSSDKPSHVFAPDQRDMLAETGAIKVQQAMAMDVLLASELAEFLRLFGEPLAQTVRQFVEDAGVFLFQRHRQRQDLALVKTMKRTHECQLEFQIPVVARILFRDQPLAIRRIGQGRLRPPGFAQRVFD